MRGLKPDTTVFEQLRNQPEFNQQIWQYLNRRVSDWRIVTGKEKAKQAAPLLARIEQDFGALGHDGLLHGCARRADPVLWRHSPLNPRL